MLGGAIKTTSAPSRRSRTDIAFIAVRILPVADIILTFVSSVNPARISSMINRNLSLFTCGIFLSEMSTIKQLINIKEAAAAFAATASFIGRGDGTRTHGLFVPNEALYQTEPHAEQQNIFYYENCIYASKIFVVLIWNKLCYNLFCCHPYTGTERGHVLFDGYTYYFHCFYHGRCSLPLHMQMVG